MWAAWSSRNIRIFEQTIPNVIQLAAGYTRLVNDYRIYVKKVLGKSGSSELKSTTSWTCPPVGFLKINTDAHIREEMFVGMGMIVRDSLGHLVAMAVKN